MSLSSVSPISAAGWSKPISQYSPTMRRAVVLLEQAGAIFLPGLGGWFVGEEAIDDVTIRALVARDDVKLSMTRKRRRGRAVLTSRGQATLAAIRRSQQPNQPEVQR